MCPQGMIQLKCYEFLFFIDVFFSHETPVVVLKMSSIMKQRVAFSLPV